MQAPKKIEKTDAEWKAALSPQEYDVIRKKGTEAAGTGEYDKFKPKEGHFVCRACGTPLYSAAAKVGREWWRVVVAFFNTYSSSTLAAGGRRSTSATRGQWRRTWT